MVMNGDADRLTGRHNRLGHFNILLAWRRIARRVIMHQNDGAGIGLVALVFRSLNSFMRPFVQMPRGFCHLAMNAAAVGYKTR